MKVSQTGLPGVLLIERVVHEDNRGSMSELFQLERYAAHGIAGPWIQDNLTGSRRGVLRGLHFQEPHSQGKLISALHGAVFDVAVDIRVGSPHFRRWVGYEISRENRRQLWIPPGFAHGFLALSETADIHYKVSHNAWSPAHERTIRWDDPEIAVDWPAPIASMSERDKEAPYLAEVGTLPGYRASN